MVHCSDGWDRTSQLTSIVQIILDPYYRTLEGFCVLIEKEWLSFGHQFPIRNGLYNENYWENNYSPIFIQWLDCISQLIQQNPSKFQFNYNLIGFIAKHLYSGYFGTFLFNNEKERVKYKSHPSIFKFLFEYGIDKYLNNSFM